MAFLPILFLEGVACCFKTTILQHFEARGYTINYGDLKEEIDRNPIYKLKSQSRTVDLLYTSKKFLELFQAKFDLSDRSPLGNYFYSIIFNILACGKYCKTPTEWTSFAEKSMEELQCDQNVVTMVKQNLLGLIFVTAEPYDDVLRRMAARKNGIDLMTHQYIIVQNCVFRHLSKLLGWDIVEIMGEHSMYTAMLKIEEKLKVLGTFKFYFPVPGRSSNVLHFARAAGAAVPRRSTPHAAGMDLSSINTYVIPPGGRTLISTGLRVRLPQGCYGRIAPRSGLATNHGIDVGAGVIDEDYRGEILVLLLNNGPADFRVNQGDRVAQLICEEIRHPQLMEVKMLPLTKRGDKGFGSSGI